MSEDKLYYWHEIKEELIRIISKEAMICMMSPQKTFIGSDQVQKVEDLRTLNDRIAQYNEGVRGLAMTLIKRMEADTVEQQ